MVKNVALFIDYENVYWSLKNNYTLVFQPGRLIDLIKQEAQKEGQVVLALAYADFDQPEFKGLQTDLQRRSVEPRHVFSKSFPEGVRKNAADIELSLDALELMYTRDDIDTYVLVCGDRDLIQLIRKLHTRNKRVSVIGVSRTTSSDLVMFSDMFTDIESLLGINPSRILSWEADLREAEMIALIQRLAALQAGNLPFVGLKMLINRLLTGFGDPQALINQAISEEIVMTYSVPNPYKPEFPTTAVKLNLEHELVQKVLGSSETEDLSLQIQGV
ncbi:MAG TPA: NYN domain-containing protein [Firmicutes bacterium]|nr:NYN domain-containing protein [Bacillota bacterium]